MALEMVRIDDRFIHGQVIVGWCPYIKPDRLILCDDEIAQSDWECEIYRDAAEDYKTSIHSIKDTADILLTNEFKNEKVFLIASSPSVIVQLVNCGVKINKIVVGGMHYQNGKRKILNFLYIDDRDLEDFRYLQTKNIVLEARDVPDCRSIDLVKRLGLN